MIVFGLQASFPYGPSGSGTAPTFRKFVEAITIYGNYAGNVMYIWMRTKLAQSSIIWKNAHVMLSHALVPTRTTAFINCLNTERHVLYSSLLQLAFIASVAAGCNRCNDLQGS